MISDKGLLLGVGDKNVSYMANKDASVVAFVREGELWTYARKAGNLWTYSAFAEMLTAIPEMQI